MHTMFYYAGVFNISNKLMRSIDILFEMREHIRKGEPGNAANAVIMAALLQPTAPVLTENEFRYLTEKVYDGCFALKYSLTDWDAAICGICGVCPIFESGDGNAKNCTPVSNEKVPIQIMLYKYSSSELEVIWKSDDEKVWYSRYWYMVESNGI